MSGKKALITILSAKLYYPALAFIMALLMLAFVPRKEIQKLFWFGLLWGTTVDLILILLFRALNFYQYIQSSPFDFFGSPMFINLAWSPAIIIFIHFLPKRKEWWIFPFYVSMFAMLGVFIGIFLHKAGLIKMIHWNDLLRFPIWWIWFYGAARHFHHLKTKDSETI